MKLKSAPSLSQLANKLCVYCSIDDFLKQKGIPCVCQDRSDFYEGDDKKLFKFGHDHWGKTVIAFWDDDYFNYYAVGDIKTIRNILKQELEDCEKE